MKKNNSQILLEKILEEGIASFQSEISLPDYFELFSATQILKSKDLTVDEIESGLVGNGGDGGIDSLYTFLNGALLKEDSEINPLKKDNRIELIIIQSKSSPKFKEVAISKLREAFEDLFDLSNNLENLKQRYNSNIIDLAEIFRKNFLELASKFVDLEVRFYFATQGDEVHPNVKEKATKLEDTIKKMFGSAKITFDFIGAEQLLAYHRENISTTRILEAAEVPISTQKGSYLCLVSLSNYFKFISDAGSIARNIFESNVRDYQGKITINNGIRETLLKEDSDDFWYLNNGVTIITPKVKMNWKILTIDNPQIVNGLQTTTEIYNHFSTIEDSHSDNRMILVRVICEDNEDARDRIIRATNSQTAIPHASLRSSDEIHRNIEDYLKAHKYYYDRKKNHYKNSGVAPTRIITIPYLAQAMMSIVLFQPNTARARPSTLLNSNEDYAKIFTDKIPIPVYLRVIEIVKRVEAFLRGELMNSRIDRKSLTNLKFYVATVVALRIAHSRDTIIEDLAQIPNIEINDELLASCLEVVNEKYLELGGTDQIAKGSQLIVRIMNEEASSSKAAPKKSKNPNIKNITLF